jgi:hypothetical protein
MKNKKLFPNLGAVFSFFLLTGFLGGDQTLEDER